MPHSHRCCQWLTALALVLLLAGCPTATAPPAATAARLSKAAEVQPGSGSRQDLEASEAAASSAETPAVGAPCQDTMHTLGGAAAGNAAMAKLLQRFCQITHRRAWRHRFLLPSHALARAYMLVGDDSRLRTFVRKLVLGVPTHYAHLGGSISVMALTKTKDQNWHAMFHRWLELVFTPCGDLLPGLDAHDRLREYGAKFHTCEQSTVTLTNHAIGATSCLFAEKCIAQRVNRTHTDWVIVEYTLNAMRGYGGEKLDTAERRALERLLRKLLLVPSRPAVTLVHTYAVSAGVAEGSYNDQVEDWHNIVAQYYGNVQAISMRAAAYEFLWRNTSTHSAVFMPDGLHPAWLGHLLWADIMIYTFKKLATEVMGELLLHAIVPTAHTRPHAIPSSVLWDEETVQLPQPLIDYYHAAGPGRRRALPPPLVPGNREDSDGFCFMSEALPPLVVGPDGAPAMTAAAAAGQGLPASGAATGQGAGAGDGTTVVGDGGEAADAVVAAVVRAPPGWSWVDESRVPGRHKWGFVSDIPGSKLVIQVDSTVGGQLHYDVEAAAASTVLGAGGGGQDAAADPKVLVQTNKGFMPLNKTHAQVMLGYLSSYEGVGAARISCVSGCSCQEQEAQALWQQRYSATSFAYMMVSAHERCRIQVEVLPGERTKFKVEGLIINSRPYYWDAASTATHYEFMATDLFNTMNP